MKWPSSDSSIPAAWEEAPDRRCGVELGILPIDVEHARVVARTADAAFHADFVILDRVRIVLFAIRVRSFAEVLRAQRQRVCAASAKTFRIGGIQEIVIAELIGRIELEEGVFLFGVELARGTREIGRIEANLEEGVVFRLVAERPEAARNIEPVIDVPSEFAEQRLLRKILDGLVCEVVVVQHIGGAAREGGVVPGLIAAQVGLLGRQAFLILVEHPST